MCAKSGGDDATNVIIASVETMIYDDSDSESFSSDAAFRGINFS